MSGFFIILEYMKIGDLKDLTKTQQLNVLAWADAMCGIHERVITAKQKFDKLPSTYGDSLGYNARMIQSKFPQRLSKRAKIHLKETLQMEVDTIIHREQKVINKAYKQYIGVDTSRLNAGALHWEHYNGGVKELTLKLIALDEPIRTPEEMLKFIAKNTYIIVKLKGIEDHIDHNTTKKGLKIWENNT